MIAIDKERLLKFLTENSDCEALNNQEYVADLYEEKPPMTVYLRVTDAGVECLAASELCYDAELDGYYMGASIEDPEAVAHALAKALESVEWN